jgi:hypothetical protein
MFIQDYPTSDAPQIVLNECGGDLMITGNDTPQVTIETESQEHLAVQRNGETLTLTVRADCVITCPAEATLTLQQANGNLSVRCVSAPLTIAAVTGNVSLRDVGEVTIATAHGDLDARQVRGALTVNALSGDARLRHIKGPVRIEQCSDLNARDLLGGADIQNARGDIWFNSELTPGTDYQLSASGDIKMHLPAKASARCTFEANGAVQCGLALAQGEKTAHRVTGQLGAGEALVKLHAGGDIAVHSDEHLRGQEIGAMIEAEMAEMEQRLQEELADLGGIGAYISEKAHRKIAQVAERARRKAEKAAQRRTEKEAKPAAPSRSKAGRFHFAWSGSLGGTSKRDQPTESASAEERLVILRMVEQKKISIEEASLLLNALEGQQ